MLRLQHLIRLPNDPPTNTHAARPMWVVWSLFSLFIGVFYLYIYTIPGLQGQLPGRPLTTVAYGLRAVCIIVLALWCFKGIPWRPVSTFEGRRGQVLATIYILLIGLSTVLSFTILIDITPYSSIQKMTYYASLIVFFIQGLIFVRRGRISRGGIVLVLALLIEIFGSVSITSEQRQAIVPFEYVLVILVAGLLIRWWSGVVLASILSPFEASLQVLGLVPGTPDVFRTLGFGIFLLTIAALAALYAHSLESALLLADERALKLETALDALTHESTAREQEAAERARVEAYAAQAEQFAVERERIRIARDFHDSLGAHLSGLTMNLRAAKAVLKHDPDSALESIVEAQQIVKEATADVRVTIDVLRTGSIAQQPLLDLMTRLIERNRAAGIKTDLKITGIPYQLNAPVNEAIYRVVQEGLTNIRKHAQATQAFVELDYHDPQRVRLRIEDNGQGAPHLADGFGLVSIRERVQQVGGKFQVTTAPGRGVCLEIEVLA
jgi:signal transduction histidine kinase